MRGAQLRLELVHFDGGPGRAELLAGQRVTTRPLAVTSTAAAAATTTTTTAAADSAADSPSQFVFAQLKPGRLLQQQSARERLLQELRAEPEPVLLVVFLVVFVVFLEFLVVLGVSADYWCGERRRRRLGLLHLRVLLERGGGGHGPDARHSPSASAAATACQ